ncbi:MAG: carbohydrate-binding domain-containing protein [Verrucomicrobiales bacterium]|nr:carbohydrate-binding domain-containing protein [Verrucomicrobiales bacterium]
MKTEHIMNKATIGLTCLLFAPGNALAAAFDYVENLAFSNTVRITFSGSTATVDNGAGSGVSISTNGANVSIESDAEGVEYILSGSSPVGSFKLVGVPACKVTLGGIDLAATDYPAISVSTTNGCYLFLADNTDNSLTDGMLYLEDIPGAVYSSGPLAISGNGRLNLTVQKEHGIYSPTNVTVRGGDITVSGSPKDALHVGGTFQMDNGTLKLTSQSDAIDADRVLLNGGSIQIDSLVDNTEGIKCDGNMVVRGGSINVRTTGARSKGIGCGGNLQIDTGDFSFILSGDVYLKPVTNNLYDAKYCAGISCDGDMTFNSGSIVMTHTGLAGKGISVDGSMMMTGGTMDITASGASSATFINEDGVSDIAATDCFKVDGSISILGGSIRLLSTGNAGDCLSCGGSLVIGVVGVTNQPCISAETTGRKVYVSGSDYANPKAVTSVGNVTINGGNIILATANDGGEGLESKANITINGGTLDISAYDDCIQADSASLTSLITINGGTIFCTASGNGEGIESKGDIVINGGHIEITAGDDCINATRGNGAGMLTINDGTIYCYSSNNDGIDCNGRMYINGGLIISSGTGAPEESFDSDTATRFNGGTAVGTAGSGFMFINTVGSDTGYCTILYNSSTLTVGSIVQVKVNGTAELVYTIPRTYSSGGGGRPGGGPPGGGGGTYLVFSDSSLTVGSSVSIWTGGTVSGGTEWHGYYRGATVSGASQVKTFTITSTGLTQVQ